jgi:acetolactate decarboxylase
MPNITATISSALLAASRDDATKRGTSLDNVINAALALYPNADSHRMYQVSTAAALVEGVYQGVVSSEVLLRQGDFGLGTFKNLEGEMVILDGQIYQILGDGRVLAREDSFRIPFAVVTRFIQEISFEIAEAQSLRALETACDHHRESDNLFYAFRIGGLFDAIHSRAVGGVGPGLRLLDAAKVQKEFHFTNVEGTLVCIRSPIYSSSFSVPSSCVERSLISQPEDIAPTLQKAFDTAAPVPIAVHVDYRDSVKLFESAHVSQIL